MVGPQSNFEDLEQPNSSTLTLTFLGSIRANVAFGVEQTEAEAKEHAQGHMDQPPVTE